MNSHLPVKPKRRRLQPGVDESSPSSTLFVQQTWDSGFDSLPIEVRYHLDQISKFYGASSSLQIHETLTLDQSRKRRRLGEPFSMTEGTETPSQGTLDKLSPSTNYDQRYFNQFGQSTTWIDPGSSSMMSPTSPLARRIADLMLMCPCCGYGIRQQEGYQQLPNGPPPAIESDTSPYMAEKPPSVQPTPSEPFTPANLGITPQNTFGYAQPTLTSPPLAGVLPLPDQPALAVQSVPLINDAAAVHDGMPATDYYTNQSLKLEPELPNQTVLAPDPLAQQDLLTLPYNTTVNVIAPEVSTQVMTVTMPINQYDLVPTDDTLDDSLPQGIYPAAYGPYIAQEATFDVLVPNQRGGKRGPFKDLTLREQTAQTRKIGSCIRCRMQRIRCETNTEEEKGACLTCKKVSNSRAGRFPCLRYKITDVRLSKPGQVPGYEWTRRWVNNISDPIQQWETEEIKTIIISDGLTSRHHVEVQVRRFIPQTGDKLERTWDYHGTRMSVQIPPFALVRLDDVKRAYTDYMRISLNDAVFGLLGSPQGLLFQTYQRAIAMVMDFSVCPEARELLNRTLMLWISVRLTTRSSFIVGQETLGMPQDILDETSPNPGKIPLPPVMGAQLDLVLIHHIQSKLRREVLDKLQRMISKNKQSTWMVIYLVMFILLHNTALIIRHDEGYALKHGMKRRFARQEKVEEYFLGANILLAHFHYCNKGIYPFSEGCKDQELRTLAGLDEEKIRYVHHTRAYASAHAHLWDVLRNSTAYGDDFFFISQLFEEGWHPRDIT